MELFCLLDGVVADASNSIVPIFSCPVMKLSRPAGDGAGSVIQLFKATVSPHWPPILSCQSQRLASSRPLFVRVFIYSH